MKTFSLRKYNSKDFPIIALGKGYNNVFTSKEHAISSLQSRFGDVRIVDNTDKKTYGQPEMSR